MKDAFERGRVTAGQDVLETLIDQLRMLGTPPLGPEFAKIRGTLLDDSLVIHRLTAKFERPGVVSQGLAAASIEKMLAYDKTYAEVQKTLFKRKGVVTDFLSARAWLHGTLKTYKPLKSIDFKGEDVDVNTAFNFPSGESVVTSRGHTDLFFKLTMDSQWTVSADCVRDATKIAYNTRALRRVVVERYKRLYVCTNGGLLDRRKVWVRQARSRGRYIGFYVFQRMFLYCVNIVSASRLAAVPKNNKEMRVITCDPVWNLIVQRSIALGLLACLKREWGIDIRYLQDIHRMRIAHRADATVDFSKASDSNWFKVFKLLFPQKVVDDVTRARTGLVEWDGEYHVLNQLAPMGCGFTFEIMTLTLMAVARSLDHTATVFGDDVIISRQAAPRFINTMTNLGWNINHEKTFLEGYFSESCGGFYNHHLQHYIVSHDLFFPENMADIIAAANKLVRILKADQVSPPVRKRLLAAYTKLLGIIPSVAFTWDPIPEGDEAKMVHVPRTVPIESFTRKSEPSYSVDYHKDSSYGKRLIPRFKSHVPICRDNVTGVMYACYMYHGVKTISTKKYELMWETYQR